MIKSMLAIGRGLRRCEDAVLVAALLIMLGTAVGQIVLRNLFDIGLLWAESFLRILVLWVAVLGAMVATREGRHINIDAVSRLARGPWLVAINLVTTLFAAVVCFAAAWHSVEFVHYEYEDGTVAFAEVPTWICQVIIPFGFAVMGLRFLAAPFAPDK